MGNNESSFLFLLYMALFGLSGLRSEVDRLTGIKILWSLGASALWVLLMWGFWRHGPDVLGLNAFLYMVAMAGLFVWSLHHQGVKVRKCLFWLVPWGLTAASFLIYYNPFLKMTSLLVLLVSSAIFCNYSLLAVRRPLHWTPHFLVQLVGRGLSFLFFVWRSIRLHTQFVSLRGVSRNGVLWRVIVGVVILAALALCVVLPLLSSADPAFADSVRSITDWFTELISSSPTHRLLFGALLSIMTLAALLAWNSPSEVQEREEKPVDSIVMGIVLGGLLAFYLLFLGIQLQKLWVGRLPFEFDEVIYLVKSGFWQLLFLSVLNVVIYVLTYRRTVPAVQKILAVFTVASLLLLCSAAWRMGLYVTYYGFSYEKFFAVYTVIYCAILFVWLVSRLFVSRRSDVIKFMAVLFVWMYALLALLPVEQFVLRTNVSLSQLPDSHVRLSELTMLSPDVLGLVREYRAAGKLEDVNMERFFLSSPTNDSALFEHDMSYAAENWGRWIERQEEVMSSKAWYETNVMDWLTAVGRN